MALIISSLYNIYDYSFNEHKDPRVEKYPLLGSPIPVIGVIILYLFFVRKWGPKWMENRQPYNLKLVIRLYNLVQIFLNLSLFTIGLQNSYLRQDFSLLCQPYDKTNNEPYMRNLIFATYLYYMSKYIDLLDTVFFVLRKKTNQITFLHVYHHAGMVFAVYIFNKFLIGSHPTLLGIINSFVHVIMYTYYFLTSFSSELKKSIWWKRHITQLQLAQFAYLLFHFTFPLFSKSCSYPKLICFIGVTQNLFMLSLFSDFYYKAYVKKKPPTTTNDNDKKNN